MDRARTLPGQDTRSRDVSRRIDQRITGYTQSVGFGGCILSCIRGDEVCVAHTRTRTRKGSITKARKPSRKPQGRLILIARACPDLSLKNRNGAERSSFPPRSECLRLSMSLLLPFRSWKPPFYLHARQLSYPSVNHFLWRLVKKEYCSFRAYTITYKGFFTRGDFLFPVAR